jgi:hypothetical protein
LATGETGIPQGIKPAIRDNVVVAG